MKVDTRAKAATVVKNNNNYKTSIITTTTLAKAVAKFAHAVLDFILQRRAHCHINGLELDMW